MERASSHKKLKSSEKPLRLIISAKKNMLVKAVKIDQKSDCSQDFLSPTKRSLSRSEAVTEFHIEGPQKWDEIPMERIQKPLKIETKPVEMREEPVTPGLRISTQAMI